ncbi:MAG: stage III sporulation protein AG [Clostridiaceae bacterium]|nr:stage III sporulation protein AG [Clostridiaceae bacterium]
MNFKEIINKYLKEGKNKGLNNLILIFLIGLVLVITASFFSSSSGNAKSQDVIGKSVLENTKNSNASVRSYEEDMQNKLKNILSKMDGVGRVDVMVTCESGEEAVPALNNNESSGTTEESSNGNKNVTTQETTTSSVVTSTDPEGSVKPFIVKTYNPKVCAVFIVAEGAENSLTQLRITKAVMDLTNVTDGKVNVLPMKK